MHSQVSERTRILAGANVGVSGTNNAMRHTELPRVKPEAPAKKILTFSDWTDSHAHQL